MLDAAHNTTGVTLRALDVSDEHLLQIDMKLMDFIPPAQTVGKIQRKMALETNSLVDKTTLIVLIQLFKNFAASRLLMG